MNVLISKIKQLTFLRIFSTQKLIKNKFLNKAGLQLFRIRLASLIYNLRKERNFPEIVDEYNAYKRDGIIQIDNFLDQEHFENVRIEARRVVEDGIWDTVREDGPNIIYIRKIQNLKEEDYPNIYKFLKNQKLNQLFQAVEKRKFDLYKGEATLQVQYLVQGEDTPSHDPETELHADTFFNTNKSWLYLDDVNLENGPFVFVRKSQNINVKDRMQKEYKFSLNMKTKGSRRVFKEELEVADLQEEVFTCPKNTLVLANTFGYHRRARGVNGYDRLTIAISARSNPFLFV